MTKNPKPQLHQSHLGMLYKCGERFRRVVVDGEREPSTTPLVVGKSTHFTVARNLNNKIDKGTLFTKEAVQDFSRDDFVKTWQESPIVLNKEERFQGLQKTRDLLQDQTIQLVTEHHYVIAPTIEPIAVERKWVIEAVDYDYDLAGCIDVDELLGLRDTKTRKTNLGQSNVDKSDQYTTYCLAKYLLDGKMPEYVFEDVLLKPTKTMPARAISYRSTRTKDDFKVLYKRHDQACRIIKAGIYTPADPTIWWCGPDWCGFAANGSCIYYNSKSRHSIKNPIIEKEKKNGYSRQTIINSLRSSII